ncbi:MAG: PAS domain S-box protein, partial [Rhodospirillales bacterium]|nr:PAS domain S-box protein [Rhodospirillales bacterium]
MHPEDRERVEAAYAELPRAKQAIELEYRVLDAAGGARVVSEVGEAIFDEAGSYIGQFGILQDITERKQAEERFRRYFDMPLVGSAIYASDKTWIQVNDKLCDLLGYSREELTKLTWVDVTHPDDLAENARLFDEAVAGERDTYSMDKRFIRKTGGILYASISVQCLRKPDGAPDYFILLIQDITTRKKAEQALRESEARFRDFAETASDWFWEMDENLRFTYLTGRFEEITGIPAEQVVGLTRKELFERHLSEPEKADRAKWREHYDQLARREPYRNVEVTWAYPDGTEKVFLNSGRPVLDDAGDFLGYRGSAVDITEQMRAQKALRKSEASLVNAQRIAKLGNWDWNIVTGELRWSDEIYRIFGLEPQQFGATYEAFLESVHPDDRETVTQAVDAALTGAVPYSIDHRIVLPDGAVRIVHEQAEVTFDGSGTPVRMSGTVQDISESVRAAEALRESEARLQYAQRVAAMGHWDWQAGEDRISFSPNVASLLGIAEEDLPDLHDGYLKFVHEDDRATLKATVGRALETSSAFAAEYRVVTPSGQTRHLSEIGEPKRGADARAVGMFGTLQDITERKRAEEVNTRLGRIVEDSINEVYVFDSESLRFLQVNRGARENLGYSMEELRALTPLDLNPEFGEESFAEAIRPLREGSQHQVVFSTIHRRKDETTYDVEVRLQIARSETPPVFLAVIQDITRRKRAEEEIRKLNEELEELVEARTAELRTAQEELVRKERLAALGQLTGTVSHELRNPLGAMRTSIAAIKKLAPQDVPLLQSSVAIVDRSITRCDNIIGDLLDYSRVRPLECETTAIDGWLANLLDEYRLPEGVALGRQLASGAEAAIDRDRLRRALINVLDNACQAVTGSGTDAEQGGTGQVTVAARCENGQVAIEIADTGPGIPAQDLDRVFEPL